MKRRTLALLGVTAVAVVVGIVIGTVIDTDAFAAGGKVESPNGVAPESPRARPLFARLAAAPDVTLVYVTGRDAGTDDGAQLRLEGAVADEHQSEPRMSLAQRRQVQVLQQRMIPRSVAERYFPARFAGVQIDGRKAAVWRFP